LILLFYAFTREVGVFKRRLRLSTPLAYEGLHGFSAIVGDKQFSVIGHGIGERQARETARRAFDSMPPAELVIATGVVGALSSDLKPGDLILADRIFASRAEGEGAELVAASAYNDLRAIASSLSAAGINFSTGRILTSHRVLTTGAEKRRAYESTGALAVDMESAAIAVEAAARGIPFIVMRAVLDQVDDEVVGAAMADEHGRVAPLAATAYLVRNPGTVLKIPRMIRNLSRAATALADALEAIAYDGKVPAPKKSALAEAANKLRR
jgi:adenosylhomocysteine nucleosidase